MAKVEIAEAVKPRKTAKSLAHLEIHPQLGGGHIVKHVYSGYQHDPHEVKFNEAGIAKGGEHIMAHLAKHAGLPGLENYDREDESETEQEMK